MSGIGGQQHPWTSGQDAGRPQIDVALMQQGLAPSVGFQQARNSSSLLLAAEAGSERGCEQTRVSTVITIEGKRSCHIPKF